MAYSDLLGLSQDEVDEGLRSGTLRRRAEINPDYMAPAPEQSVTAQPFQRMPSQRLGGGSSGNFVRIGPQEAFVPHPSNPSPGLYVDYPEVWEPPGGISAGKLLTPPRMNPNDQVWEDLSRRDLRRFGGNFNAANDWANKNDKDRLRWMQSKQQQRQYEAQQAELERILISKDYDPIDIANAKAAGMLGDLLRKDIRSIKTTAEKSLAAQKEARKQAAEEAKGWKPDVNKVTGEITEQKSDPMTGTFDERKLTTAEGFRPFQPKEDAWSGTVPEGETWKAEVLDAAGRPIPGKFKDMEGGTKWSINRSKYGAPEGGIQYTPKEETPEQIAKKQELAEKKKTAEYEKQTKAERKVADNAWSAFSNPAVDTRINKLNVEIDKLNKETGDERNVEKLRELKTRLDTLQKNRAMAREKYYKQAQVLIDRGVDEDSLPHRVKGDPLGDYVPKEAELSETETPPVQKQQPVAPATQQQGETPSFNSMQEAEAANLPSGTIIQVMHEGRLRRARVK